MDLQTQKLELMQLLLNTQEESVIERLKQVFKSSEGQVNKDWWDEIDKTEKLEIEEGVKQLDSGDFISHEEVLKNTRKWVYR